MKILLPVDGSKYAMEGARMALDLVKAKWAKVKIVAVVPLYPDIDLEISARARESLEGKLSRRAEQALSEVKDFFQSNGVATEAVLIESAHVADEIIDLAEKEKYDLIVIGSQGLGATRRFHLGGTAQKVVSQAPCSVLVAKLPE